MRCLILILICLPIAGLSQHTCATMEKTRSYADMSSEYAAGLDSLKSFAIRYEQGAVIGQARGVDEVTIPIVVHVVYRNESDNISMAQIQSQIDALNRDFNWQQSDKDKIPEIWRGLGRTTGFNFQLADVDPDGNFTNGVTRTKTTIENIGDDDAYYSTAHGGIDPWFQAHYINIWVCEIGNNTLGYTYLPSTSAEPNDGIVMDPRAFGMIGTATPPYDQGRTLVHEMGHYFGLRHPWGNEEGSCTNTDYMNDTPWQREANFGCPDFPSKTCASAPNGDMFMNFMDYTRDTCALLFTKDQVEFMQLVLLTSKVTLTHSTAVTGFREREAKHQNQIVAYPNPADDLLYLESIGEREVDFSLFSILGARVIFGKLQPGINTLKIHAIDNGIYTLESELGVQKIVVSR